MPLRLTTIDLDDFDLVAHIETETDVERFSGGSLAGIFAQLRASPPRQTPFAVFDAETAVAFLVAREGAALPDWAEAGAMTLNNLRVDRRLLGCGYGKAAIRLAATWIARERPGVKTIMSSVNVANEAAFRLNVSCGLKPTGQTVTGRFGLQRLMSAPVTQICSGQPGSTSTSSL